MAIIKHPTNYDDQVKFVMAARGVGEGAAEAVIKSIGFESVYQEINRAFSNTLEKTISRPLGQIANALNPANLANTGNGGVAAPSTKELEEYEQNLLNALKGNSIYYDNPAWREHVFAPEFMDQVNAGIASGAKYFGPDFIQKAGGFKPGGTTNSVTVDYIGQLTGQSQPQTFTWDSKTGKVEAGEMAPVESVKPSNPASKTTASARPNAKIDEAAQKLVDTALQTNQTQNLSQQTFWSSQPLEVRQKAYAELQNVLSSPQNLANYVSQKGLTNLQQYDWWNGNANKVAAYDLILTGKVDKPIIEGEDGLMKVAPTQTKTLRDIDPMLSQEQPKGSVVGTGATVFNTGNKNLDSFLNDVWLPLLEAEMGGDPTAILNDELFANIKDRVEATWGPIFQNELDLAQSTFNRDKEGVVAADEKIQRDLTTQLETGLQDIGTEKSRTLEDTGIQTKRIARNYQEALMESQAAMANRQLTFSGIRNKEEQKLATQKEEAIGDVNRAAGRTLTDLTTKGSRLEADVASDKAFQTGQTGRSIAELEAGLTQKQKDIEGERVLQTAAERERIRTLGGSLLSNPEFMPT